MEAVFLKYDSSADYDRLNDVHSLCEYKHFQSYYRPISRNMAISRSYFVITDFQYCLSEKDEDLTFSVVTNRGSG